jgi:hypothetical protein
MNKRLVKCLLAIAIMVFAQARALAVNNNSTLS